MKIQNSVFVTGLNANPRNLELSRIGKTKSTKIAANINITPTNFWGIERKIA